MLPQNPRRNARRALILWEEQVARDQEKKVATHETDNRRESEDRSTKKDQGLSNLKDEESQDKIVESERKRNFNVGRLFQRPIDPNKGLRYGVEELSEDDIASLIRERADKLASGDERLVSDFTSMIDLLRENPTPNGNLGITRMSDRKMVIDGIPHPLWRLSPFKVQGLPLTHPESLSMRVVYGIYKKEGKKLVILDGDGIYTHRQFDRRYGTSGHGNR